MFRVRIRNQDLWRRLRKMPVLRKLVRADMLSIPTMTNPGIIDSAFSDIDLLSGVSKQTNKDRFASVDEISVRIISSRSLSKIHDVGVSSGITSLELRRQLREASFDGEMFISDKFARFWVNRHGLATDIYDAEHNLVCAYLGPITGDSEDTWKFPLSKLVYRRALKRSFSEGDQREFLLLHPDVLAAIEQGDISFIDFDVFQNERENTFDFVRCMNLLNRGYFSTEIIENGLKALHISLASGGVMQIGRTHIEGGNHVTFYEKTADGFQPLESIGDGSEIDQLVTEFRTAA